MLVQLETGPPAAATRPAFHLFETELGPHVLAVDGSRIYGIAREVAEAVARGEPVPGLDSSYIDDTPVIDPPVLSLSLAVAQKCNLGCVYCYAQQGTFGGEAKNMPRETAIRAIDMLVAGTAPTDRIHIAFLGGEPLANRTVIREATEYAAATGRAVGFSITTNGTLVEPSDGEFFEKHAFAVTISLDGAGEAHDRTRPFRDGRGSFARIIERVKPLLAMQSRMQVSARVTVTPANMGVEDTLDQLVALGFHSVGFSPMLASPTGHGQMDPSDLEEMLEAMVACGRKFEDAVVAGRRYPFSNMSNAMREIHRGTHRPYPCGAGAGYLGVSADGDLAACHRFVGESAGAMGSLDAGIDRDARARWLGGRHVHFQQPCASCWARYLCGGGCHHEAIHRGRMSCDYVRGWLDYCLKAYVRLLDRRPDYFG
jgi:uncharacterized protein